MATSSEIEAAYGANQERYEAQRPNEGAIVKTSLKAVSMNLGLLQSPSEVPNFDQRSRLLSEQLGWFLKTGSPDVMFLQEAWDDNPDNIITIRETAKSNGYLSVQELFEKTKAYESSQSRNGLDILVKQSALSTEVGVSKTTFSSISKSLLATLGGYDRGVLHTQLKLSNGQTLLIATSHFTPNLAKPTYNQDDTRRKQAKQASEIIKTAGADTDFVIFGGDLNFSPEFEHKVTDGRKSDARDSVWEGSTKSYPILLEESLLIDSYKVINADKGYTQDRALNPMSNVSPSTDGEPEQRLDYIWVGSYKNNAHLEISNSYFVFNSPLVDQNGDVIQAEDYVGPLFMSDHFGIATELSLY